MIYEIKLSSYMMFEVVKKKWRLNFKGLYQLLKGFKRNMVFLYLTLKCMNLFIILDIR